MKTIRTYSANLNNFNKVSKSISKMVDNNTIHFITTINSLKKLNKPFPDTEGFDTPEKILKIYQEGLAALLDYKSPIKKLIVVNIELYGRIEVPYSITTISADYETTTTFTYNAK